MLVRICLALNLPLLRAVGWEKAVLVPAMIVPNMTISDNEDKPIIFFQECRICAKRKRGQYQAASNRHHWISRYRQEDCSKCPLPFDGFEGYFAQQVRTRNQIWQKDRQGICS